MNVAGGMTIDDAKFMINDVFLNYHNFQFKIKLPHFTPTNVQNIEITNEFIEQKQILCNFYLFLN